MGRKGNDRLVDPKKVEMFSQQFANLRQGEISSHVLQPLGAQQLQVGESQNSTSPQITVNDFFPASKIIFVDLNVMGGMFWPTFKGREFTEKKTDAGPDI